MSPLELLRFGWKPNEFRILLASLADAGPVSRRVWLVRTQIPRSDHFREALAEVSRLQGAECREGPEGLAVFVRPVVFWRAKPLADENAWRAAWAGVAAEQVRFDLPTEMPSLAEAMAVGTNGHLTPALSPRGGEGEEVDGVASRFSGENLPDSGKPVKRLNDLTVDRNSLAFTVERLNVPENREEDSREGWIEPENERDMLAAVVRLLGAEESRLWGGMWVNRWRRNAAGVRKVLNMVREDKARGMTPRKSWGRHSSDLWKRFVDRAAVVNECNTKVGEVAGRKPQKEQNDAQR